MSFGFDLFPQLSVLCVKHIDEMLQVPHVSFCFILFQLKVLRTKKDSEEMLQDKEYVDYEEDEIEHIKEENVKPPAEEVNVKHLVSRAAWSQA
jgi:fucose 4-O-acetylase-like acetyltransferase